MWAIQAAESEGEQLNAFIVFVSCEKLVCRLLTRWHGKVEKVRKAIPGENVGGILYKCPSTLYPDSFVYYWAFEPYVITQDTI